jgi:hypothetical protein
MFQVLQFAMRLPPEIARRIEDAGNDKLTRGVPRGYREVLVETLERLLAAFYGAVLLDHAIALIGGGEDCPHGDLGLVALRHERHRRLKAHGLKIFIAAMLVDGVGFDGLLLVTLGMGLQPRRG